MATVYPDQPSSSAAALAKNATNWISARTTATCGAGTAHSRAFESIIDDVLPQLFAKSHSKSEAYP
jgi:hypothetical protein